MLDKEVHDIINTLQLQRHPEGGYYKEIYRSIETIPVEILENRKNSKKKNRNICTSIYYLLIKEDVSVFHRIKSDEIWHFYKGSPVLLHLLDEETKSYKKIQLGEYCNYQCVVPKNIWFAAEVVDKNSFALVGCTVSPGFEFEDFEIASYNKLIHLFPEYESLIHKFTKNKLD
ncbi:MAG: hypothetical protein KatS3mg129_2246 [Leptospiraceae bacterium]|nr:MAG: hypothetical protein KatS3mg129_2246 [Leptospiraceae bacterium]